MLNLGFHLPLLISEKTRIKPSENTETGEQNMKKQIIGMLVAVVLVSAVSLLTGCATTSREGREDFVMVSGTKVVKGVEPKNGQLVSVLSVVQNPMSEQHEYVITWQYLWSNLDVRPQGLQVLIVKGTLYAGLTSDGFVTGTYLVEPIFGDTPRANTMRFTPMVIKSK